MGKSSWLFSICTRQSSAQCTAVQTALIWLHETVRLRRLSLSAPHNFPKKSQWVLQLLEAKIISHWESPVNMKTQNIPPLNISPIQHACKIKTVDYETNQSFSAMAVKWVSISASVNTLKQKQTKIMFYYLQSNTTYLCTLVVSFLPKCALIKWRSSSNL